MVEKCRLWLVTLLSRVKVERVAGIPFSVCQIKGIASYGTGLNMWFYNSVFLSATEPAFAHNRLVLKEKGPLLVEQPFEKLGKITSRSEIGSTFEHLVSLLTLLEPVIQPDINFKGDAANSWRLEA